MTPRVSIIIPLHNAGAYIAAAIESLRAQTLQDWEAIIVDDASTDGGAEIVRRFAHDDARIMLLQQSHAGPGAARNRGIEASSGEYLHFLDADDLMLPDGLSTLMRAAEGSRWRAAFGGMELIDAEGASLESPRLELAADVGLDEHLSYCRFGVHQQIIHRQTLGMARFAARGAEEVLPLWHELSLRGVRWVNCGTIVCAYRTHDAGRSRDFRAGAESNIEAVRAAFEQAKVVGWAERGVDLSDTRREARERQIAFDYAHMAVLPDPTPMKDAAWRTLMLAPPGPMSDEAALERFASSAFAVLPIAAYRTRAAWIDEPEPLVRAAGRWWHRLEDEGLVTAGFALRARRALARLIVDDAGHRPGVIARRIVKECETSARIELLGLGKNGTALAQAFASEGVRVRARDDAMQPGVQRVGAMGVEVEVVPSGAPFDASATYVMTVLHDEAYMRRLQGDLRPVRWREARESLGEELESRLIEAWPTRRELLRAA